MFAQGNYGMLVSNPNGVNLHFGKRGVRMLGIAVSNPNGVNLHQDTLWSLQRTYIVSNPNGVNLHLIKGLDFNDRLKVSNPNGVNLHSLIGEIAKQNEICFKPQRGKFTQQSAKRRAHTQAFQTPTG